MNTALEFAKIVGASRSIGIVTTTTEKTATWVGAVPTVPPKRVGYAQAYAEFVRMAYRNIQHVERFNILGTWWCVSGDVTSYRSAKVPISSTICHWLDPITRCTKSIYYSGGSGGYGQPPGSGTPAPPPGPQPVTDVRGLADGTLLHTTDTGRIYKMVGGAPVWQATCNDNICSGTPRPTTQGVINAGPATPRNATSAIDQRGRIYIFVGGFPVWQDSCAAPVTCGTPVKISDWSIDARDHMNQVPADGNLVQAKDGNTDLPVSMTLGGALVPFANPQEVIDVGQGTDWASRVVAISAGSYNRIGFIPTDGTLVQGTSGGASTAVAMYLGGAKIPFANPQEVIDAGYGAGWASKVRAIPSRHFNTLPTVPDDGTLLQGSNGSTPVAAMIGLARVNFGSPQEVIDAGFGTDWGSKVRAVPERVFNSLPTQIMDGTRIKNGTLTAQAVVVGGAKMPFASLEELNGSGYGDRPVWTIPTRTWDALPTKIADGTRIKNAGSSAQAAIIGGAKMPFTSIDELIASGYGNRPVQVVPARVWDALPNDIGDGVRIGKAGDTAQAAVVGGAKIPFISMEELESAGYADDPLHILPARVWDALPGRIGDGTRIVKAGTTSEAAIVGGAKIEFHTMAELTASGYGDEPRQTIPVRVWDNLNEQIADGTRIVKAGTTSEAAIVGGAKVEFHTMEELTASGYKDKPRQVIPVRVWDGLTRQIKDGTRIAKAGTTSEAAIVGGAKIEFHTMAELTASGYGDKPRQTIPVRVWDNLNEQIADGTYVKSPDSATVWLINAGRRTAAQQSSNVQVIPARVLNAIPLS
ncbi:hypothetical protein ETD86_20290 [Nonomuraea turkmeniaca]|uniref:Uncharacterized protein n=1 Tax=Nonomuraea turkmeniaca TaxID=103838 RepID=A0A5S4FH89_9ACTN|nr:hypothetical protein [Nonomuraea turkmeniaca]TMR19312.1 hypothetical protein ETD86_20290 [Nonomuraea turkmeniaca]